MTVEQLNSRISVVNAESKRINNERQMNIGKRETLTKQLSEALEHYKQTYGVELTPETFESEFQRVAELREKEVEHLEKIIGCINAGNYEEAKLLISGESGVASSKEENNAVVEETTPVQQEEKAVETLKITPITDSITPSAVQEQTPIASPIQNATTPTPVAPAPAPMPSVAPTVTEQMPSATPVAPAPMPSVAPTVTEQMPSATPVAPAPMPSVAPATPVAPVAPAPMPSVAPAPAPTPMSSVAPAPVPAPSVAPAPMPSGFVPLDNAQAQSGVAPAPTTPNKGITSFGAVLGGQPLQP